MGRSTGKYTGQYPNPRKYLEKGDKGTEVRKLQEYLNWYTDGVFFAKCGGADGIYGKNTLKYTKKMQTDFFGKKEADGKVGPKTINKMKEVGGYTPEPQPTGRMKGADISTWQGKISVANFQKAKADGISFVILRVGYTGSSSKAPTLDNTFENNYANAVAAGMKVGYYYYSLATTEAMARKEAEFVLAHISGKQCDMPVYLDVEDPRYQSKASKSTLAMVCNTFCNLINAAGYRAGVYASVSWFNNKIGSISAPHSKWVAQYYKECQYKGTYDMWQYTSSGKVPGFSGNIDLNWWYTR